MRAQTRRRTFHSVCRVKKKAVDGRFSLCCSPTPKWFSFFFIFPTLSHFFPPTWSANTNALIRMRVTYCSVRSYHLDEEKRCEHHSRRRRFRFECWGCTSALPFSSIIIVPDKQESTGSVRGATGPGVGGGERLFLSWPSARTKATARKSWERFFPTEIAAAAALARAFFFFFSFKRPISLPGEFVITARWFRRAGMGLRETATKTKTKKKQKKAWAFLLVCRPVTRPKLLHSRKRERNNWFPAASSTESDRD